ncbi:MAG: HEAT repeat domain-containing protein [Acidimicrobiia bacterium]|nr:HEAT repeat domain-containing protein [Acidimicrobiia bacterium]
MTQRDQLIQLVTDPGALLGAPEADIRRIAVAAAAGHDSLRDRVIEMLAADPDPAVRRECAEVLGRSGARPVTELIRAVADEVPTVREAAITALGEAADTEPVPLLISIAAADEEDKLVREAAVAALGAIADERARPALLHLIASGPPQIRRRCVPALTVFDGEDIAAALLAAATDRNPMVREAAEMVVGRQTGHGD